MQTNSFQLERGREPSLGTRVTDVNAPYIDINKVKQGHIICTVYNVILSGYNLTAEKAI